jgi:hypothetical protein
MGDRIAYKSFVLKAKGKRQLGNIGIDGRIILKWNLKQWGMMLGTGFI